MAMRILQSGGIAGGFSQSVIHIIHPQTRELQQEVETLKLQCDEARAKSQEARSKRQGICFNSEELKILDKQYGNSTEEFKNLHEEIEGKGKILNKITNIDTIELTLCQGLTLTTAEAQLQGKSQKMKPGRFVRVRSSGEKHEMKGNKSEIVSEGHSASFISGHHDRNSMKIGDKIRIGHMNYVGKAGNIYLKKPDNEEFQLVYDFCGKVELPITKDSNLTKLDFYPDFLAQNEPVQA
jgi:hypothetical protein